MLVLLHAFWRMYAAKVLEVIHVTLKLLTEYLMPWKELKGRVRPLNPSM